MSKKMNASKLLRSASYALVALTVGFQQLCFLPAISLAAEAQEFHKTSKGINNGSTIVVLKNNLRVILVNQPSFPTVSCQLWYHQGANSEGDHYQGSCYALKHVLDVKPLLKNKDLAIDLLKRAAKFDSFVADDFTTFAVNAMAEDLPHCLTLQAERYNTTKLSTQDLLDGLNESKDAILNHFVSPEEQLQSDLRKLAFPAKHSVFKTNKTRESSVDRVNAFFKHSLLKAPVTLVVAGNFDSANVLKLVEETFVRKAHKKSAHQHHHSHKSAHERSFSKFIKGNSNHVLVAYKTPNLESADLAPFVVLESLLNSKVGGILKNRFQDEANLICTKTKAELQLGKGEGLFNVYLVSDKAIGATLVLKEWEQLINSLRDISIDSIGLERAKRRAQMRFLKQQAGPYEAAYQLGFFDSLSNHQLFADWQSRLNKVTDQDILRVCQKYLKDDKRFVGTFKTNSSSPKEAKNDDDYQSIRLSSHVPLDAKATVATTGNGSTNKTAIKSPTHYTDIKVQSKKLDNGITLTVFPIPNSGIVSIRGAVRSGYGFETADKRGTSIVNTSMLNGDSVKIGLKKSRTLQADNGLSKEDLLTFKNGPEFVRFKCNSLSEKIDTQLKLISHHIRHPALDAGKLPRILEKTKSELVIANSNLENKLERHLLRNLLSKKSPFTPLQINKQLASIDKLSLEDITQFREKTISPTALTMVAVGDIDLATFSTHVQNIFSDWKRSEVSSLPSISKNKRQVLKVVLPGASEKDDSELLIGKLIQKPISTCKEALNITECALIKHPLLARIPRPTYGNNITFETEKIGNQTLWTVAINSDKTKFENTFNRFKTAIDRINSKGISESEIKDLKSFVLRDNVINKASNMFDIADHLLEQQVQFPGASNTASIPSNSAEQLNKFIRDDLQVKRSCLVFELSKDSKNLAKSLNLHK